MIYIYIAKINFSNERFWVQTTKHEQRLFSHLGLATEYVFCIVLIFMLSKKHTLHEDVFICLIHEMCRRINNQNNFQYLLLIMS